MVQGSASDLKRYDEFVGRKLHDLIVVAEAKATANGRDVRSPSSEDWERAFRIFDLLL